MKKIKTFSLLLFVLFSILFFSIKTSTPVFSLQNSLLNAQSNYIMNYYNFRPFLTSSYFQIDFSQSDIVVGDGQLNVTASLDKTSVTQTLISANCTNKVCIIRLGTAFPNNTNVQISFGQFRNPKYTANQRITVFVYFGVNSNQTQTISMSSSAYTVMPIIVNSITQSNYGVGSQDVTYWLNLSFSYVPKNPQIQIQIPSQITYTTLDTQLSFYGTIQNISPTLTINMIILSLTIDQILNPNGFMLLTLKGFRNPQFIGTSSSFNVTMIQKRTPTSSNCVTCRVAYLNRLLNVSSTTPGDIIMNIFNPSSYLVSDKVNLTLGIRIVAPIPDGGKFRIILPTSIVPIMPISCQAVYGFNILNPAYCVYNQTTNTIQTVNFSIPFLEQTGDAIIRIAVINPKDSRPTQFNFETLDNQNRKIGKNKDPFIYTAVPLNLNTSMTKNTTFLESVYTLSATITLSQSLNNTSDSILVILPPSQFYNLSAIQCVASSVTIPCNKTYQNITNNLLIQFSPPCSVCNASSTISFRINNLINPSFINDEMKTVQIQTLTTFGVIQEFSGVIQLKQKDLVINQLNWQGTQQVGSDYKLILNYELPKYIQKYGGYLVINFNQNSSFANVVVNGSSYSYPKSLTILNQNNQTLLNTISYFESSKIKSLQQIKIKICSTDSPCASNITVLALRKPYYPLTSAMMSFKGQTLNAQAISTSSKDVSSFMPQSIVSTLSVNSTISITNTISNYIFKFTVNRLPFDSGLRVDLTSRHQIQNNGRCFVETSPSTLLGYGIDCSINNSTSLTLSYSGDLVFMTTGQIQYIVTVINVLNPPSLMPISYKVQPSYNSMKIATYSSSYTLSDAYSLIADQINSLNTTYGQNSILSIKLRTGYYTFDQLRLYLPKQNYKTFTSLNSILQSAGSYKMTQNSTHFILDKIYTLPNAFTIELSNALNTSAVGKLQAQMYVQGYLSSKGSFTLPKITPVYLYGTVSSSNRFVGQNTSLTFDIRRVNAYNQQKTIKISFSSLAFTAPSGNQLFTTDQSNSQIYSYTQQLSTWTSTSKIITLTSFINMKYIPFNLSLVKIPKLNISTFDDTNSIVSTISIDLIDLIPFKTKDSISYSFIRTSVQSLSNTDIMIDFLPRYPYMVKLLKVQIPINQNKLQTDTSCLIGDTNVMNACQIIDNLWNTLTIQYPTGATKITLKNVWNQFPSDSNLTLTLMTQDYEFIQQSSKQILPSIDFDPLQMSCVANTSSVSSPVQLNFTIRSVQNIIDIGSRIKFILPQKIYYRQFSVLNKDCQYEINGLKYTGCQYEIDQVDDNKQWMQYVTVSNFGYMQLMPNTTIKIILYFINPYTAYSFGQKNITVIQYNSLYQQVAKGYILLNSLYPNLSSFTPVNIANYNFIEMNKMCNSDNYFNLTITLPVNISSQTYLYLVLPTAYFIYANQTGFQVQSQNVSFIKVKKLITQCSMFSSSLGMCSKVNDTLNIMFKVTNQKYFKILDPKPKITIYLWNDNSAVTSNLDISLADRIPTSIPNLNIQRSTGNLSQKVTTTLKFTLQSAFNLSKQTKVSIAPVNSSIGLMKTMDSWKFITSTAQSSNLVLSNLLNGKQIILTSSFYPSSIIQMQMSGSNPSFAPNLMSQDYIVKIYDDSYVYYSNTVSLSAQNKLKPLSEGIDIKRSNSQVNTFANYTITGSLPFGVDYGRLVFNGTTTIPANSLTDFINMRVGQYMNPSSSNWDTYQSISILNDTHILFMNNKIKTAPSLTSLTLPVNTINSIIYNEQMRINTQQTIIITFGSAVSNVDKINIKLPTIFKSIKNIKVNSQTISSFKLSEITSIQSTQSLIQIPVTSSTSKIQLTIMTLDYQKLFKNTNITIQTEYPTQSYQQSFNVNVYGTMLGTNLKMTSFKVNQQNKIQVTITPLNKNNTVLNVYFPSFVNTQLQNLLQDNQLSSVVNFVQNSVSKTFNLAFSNDLNVYYFNYPLDQIAINSPFTLTLDSIVNPKTNEPYYFIIEQKETTGQNSIIGHSSVQVTMKTLQQLYVRSAQRNTSKIGVPVQIQTQIQIPTSLKDSTINSLTQESCVIQMPLVQVVRNSPQSSCQVYLIGQNSETKLSCQMHPTLNNSIITSCKSGLNKYSIRKGFKNMLYSIVPNSAQKPYVFIGQPYKMAESDLTSTSFLSPIVTSGSLNLNKLASSSSVRLQKTTLSLDITLQNIQQVDCVNFKFQKQNYIYLNNDLKCKSNGQQTDCWSPQTGSIMVNVSSIVSNSLSVEINGLVNFLRQGNFTIKTLKYLAGSVTTQTINPNGLPMASSSINVQSAPQSAFGLIDIFYSSLTDLGQSFVSNKYKTRVINPQNYVSDQMKKIQIIFDDQNSLPSALDQNQLQFNITTNLQECQLTNSDFSTSLVMSCKFTQSMDFSINVKLFHKKYSDIQLSSNQFNSYIYPALSDNCQNQMCDKCSTGPSGQQKCFSCRQNYYQYQNGCIQTCPNGYTSYQQYMTCQQCSSNCQTCYGLYWNNCLKCSNSTLLSQNGLCVQTCNSGYPDNGYCIGDNECYDKGCRTCSATGFCYQCLPDYQGQPTCTWQQLLPPVFMTYFVIPFILYALVSTGVFLALKGVVTMTYQVIFSFSLLEFAIWILIIPALHTKQQAMLLLSMIVLRIVLGIVAYETFYKKQINSHIGLNEQQSLLEKQKSSQKQSKNQQNKEQGSLHFDQDWKSRIIRFLAHTNGIDSYQAFKVVFSSQLRIQHNDLYLWISTANRILVCAFMFYVLSQGVKGDLIILPIVTFLSSLAVLSLRAVKSKKLQQCWQKMRGSTR